MTVPAAVHIQIISFWPCAQRKWTFFQSICKGLSSFVEDFKKTEVLLLRSMFSLLKLELNGGLKASTKLLDKCCIHSPYTS